MKKKIVKSKCPPPKILSNPGQKLVKWEESISRISFFDNFRLIDAFYFTIFFSWRKICIITGSSIIPNNYFVLSLFSQFRSLKNYVLLIKLRRVEKCSWSFQKVLWNFSRSASHQENRSGLWNLDQNSRRKSWRKIELK